MLKSLEDTTLWKRLDEGFKGTDEEVAKELAGNLKRICKEASDRMKAFPSLHPQYTLHDETHLLRVTELMAKIIPEETLGKLNPVEISFLILSAYYHDQGMVLDNEELGALDSNPEFKIFSDTWAIDHPNLHEVQQQLSDKNLSSEEKERCSRIEQELHAALLTDYVRKTHGSKSAKFVRSHEGNPLWEIAGTKFAYLVAMLCESHVKPASDLSREKGFYHDQSVGAYKVNMPYLGLVLRLADILDFDRERTPEALYRTIHFTSAVSLVEWEKHRSVEGWDISPKTVRFDMRCEHPIYQRAALEFMGWIDDELAAAHAIVKQFPFDFQDYKFDLPFRTDVSRIKAKDDAYIYHDLEFSLSRDEVVKLLMMEELYQSPSLSVRELLQNALDALRYRKALIKRDNGADWADGKVYMEHTVDENGYEVVLCTDNGVGMDEQVITRFLTNVGRSYYRSPEFKQERVTFREAGVDFDPCSQFGIGFMSYFMIGDRIIIQTRRDYGPKIGRGKPLVVEINGLGGIIVIRRGSQDQEVGTAVKIIGRKKPRFLDELKDRIKLVDTVDGYALATEYPIEAHCTIPEIEGATSIPPTIAIQTTEMERAGIRLCKTFEQAFSEIDPMMNGLIRASVLTDKNGRLTIENDEAEWILEETLPKLYKTQSYEEISGEYDLDHGTVCLDGILVCGLPGRYGRIPGLGWYANHVSLGRHFFVLDVRGPLKPPLTPARGPPRYFGNEGPSWYRLKHLAGLAQGRLWEQVAEYLDDGDDGNNGEIFWQLAAIHRAMISFMRSGKIWSYVSIPIQKGGKVEWRRISSLEMNKILGDTFSFELTYQYLFGITTQDGAKVLAYDKLEELNSTLYYYNIEETFKEIIVAMSTITLKDGETYLEIRDPIHPEKAPSEFNIDMIKSLPYSGFPRDILSVHLPFPNVNRDHALVKMALDAKYLESPSEIQQFALSVVRGLSRSLRVLSCPEGPIPDIDNANGYVLRRLSHQYFELDWSRYGEDLRPPYAVWLKDIGRFEITEDHFRRWAEISKR